MAGETVSAAEFFSEPIQSGPSKKPDAGGVVSPEDFFGETAQEKPPVISSIPDEHQGRFVQEFGRAIYEGMGYTAKRFYAAAGAGAAGINDVIGYITGLNSFQKYRDFVQGGFEYQQQVKAERPDAMGFERIYYGFVDGLGTLAPTLPIDVMTGGATKIALAGRILPKMEALLSRIPNFVLGSGWRGMVNGIEASGETLPEKVAGGLVGAGENMAVSTLYANAGIGLQGIGKMASIGAADAFYNAAKQGRIPTSQEVIDNSTQSAMLGVVFTALPYLVEGSKIESEKRALTAFSRKFERIVGMTEESVKYSTPQEIHKLATDLFESPDIRPEIKQSLIQPFLDRLDQRGTVSTPEFKLGMWKDRSKLRMNRETMERNIENVAGKDAKAVQMETTEKIKENETYHQRWVDTVNKLIQDEELVPRGIRPNSEQSKLTMRFGEGRMTEKELQAARPDDWKEIVAGAKFCREIYDTTLKDVNRVREKYGYEPIAKREDYFRHFQEISVADKLFGHFLGGEKPPTSAAGVINRAKYGKPFSSTELQRMGGEFKEDAVLALQNYVKSIGPQLFHLDSVQRIRGLERYIRAQALSNEAQIKEGQLVAKLDLSNFTEKLTTYADFMAGQPSLLTQAINRFADRPFFAGIRALQRNVVLNMISGNISAAFMNWLPVAQQVASTNPKALMKGWATSALHLNREVPFELENVRSEFYDRRYPRGFLPANWMENVADKGFILANAVDRMTVQALIAGKFWEGKAQGLDAVTAMKEADNYAVRVVTDRTKGQVPSIMTEPDLKLISAFQVEINNLWSWLAHDIPKESQGKFWETAGRITVFALASNVINNLYEKILGRRPQLDFIEVLGLLGSAAIEREPEYLQRAGKALLGNVPFGNLFVEGGRFPLAAAIPDMGKFFEDPERLAWDEFKKPLWYLLPFGYGGQARKTIQGLSAWNEGGVYTPAENLRYEVQKDFMNFVRGFLFGKNSFPEAVDYWNTLKSER